MAIVLSIEIVQELVINDTLSRWQGLANTKNTQIHQSYGLVCLLNIDVLQN